MNLQEWSQLDPPWFNEPDAIDLRIALFLTRRVDVSHLQAKEKVPYMDRAKFIGFTQEWIARDLAGYDEGEGE